MSAILKADTGLDYDRACWTEWVPDCSRVHKAGGLASLYQRTPAAATAVNETLAPGVSSTILLFWTRGQSFESRLDGRAHRLASRPWQFTLLPSGCESWWASTPEAANGVFHLHLRPDLIADAIEGALGPGELPLAPLAADPVIEQAARWLFEELAADIPPSRLVWDTGALTLALRLTRVRAPATGTRGGLAPWQVRRVTECLEAHLADDLPLAALASLVGLSPNHFCTAFRISLGEPPHRWLVRRRIERAKKLLADLRLSVTDVALAVGFGSSAHFATAFRKQVGATPTDYRRERLS